MRFSRQSLSIYLWIAALLILLNLVWTFASRHAAKQRFKREAQRQEAEKYRPYAADGSTELKILHFYASAGEISAGSEVLVCYGVRNATTVRIEPPVQELAPSPNRCFTVVPRATTAYTLIASGAGNSEVSASFSLKVTPTAP